MAQIADLQAHNMSMAICYLKYFKVFQNSKTGKEDLG